jgi:hypothetical protein
MNYYILPKNNITFNINLILKEEEPEAIVSYSLIFYLNNIYKQLSNIKNIHNDITIENAKQIINPYEYIYTNLEGTSVSVSKVKPESNIFFEMMEVLQISNMIEYLSFKKNINIAHFTHNYISTNYLLNMLREDKEDNILNLDFNYENINTNYILKNLGLKIDLFIFEFKEENCNNSNNYVKNILLVLQLILKYQINGGNTIIKIDNIFIKPIIDILFIFSCIFDKVYLFKPCLCNITKGDRYIICKNLSIDSYTQSKMLDKLEEEINKNDIKKTKLNIHSIITNEIPYYFLNKIEESNSIIGQQQLESYDQIINIINSKKNDEKIETYKRNNLQKCIQWCEKNQLPHNKFTEKINMFL